MRERGFWEFLPCRQSYAPEKPYLILVDFSSKVYAHPTQYTCVVMKYLHRFHYVLRKRYGAYSCDVAKQSYDETNLLPKKLLTAYNIGWASFERPS